MSGRRIIATAWRVFTQLRHDSRTIVLMLIAPSALIGLFSWLFDDQRIVFERFGGPILALFPFIVMFLVTSITTLRERRSGTLERLMTTPLAKSDFILGYALSFGIIAVVQATLTVSFAVWVCGYDVSGSLWKFGGVVILCAILGTALGLCTSAFARTEFQAVQFMPALVFPQILVGGVFRPREEMPRGLELISDWLPLSYAIDAVDASSEGKTGWDIGAPLVVVGVFIVGLLMLASLTLRRQTP